MKILPREHIEFDVSSDEDGFFWVGCGIFFELSEDDKRFDTLADAASAAECALMPHMEEVSESEVEAQYNF